ncbi:NUDIX hydrolase [Bacillus sp. CHD6a]|uniref:NUDIX hydrolase n=1 Tax=Bacillus sp. CHD6a TaxID=1643452 RepID=UPI0006CC6F32|nr:NUDIX hydrolase [Bacillus sp. CHD6a]KPB06273.1 NTP pyrophosphohydrolase [Bacillus sp. CHD6a]
MGIKKDYISFIREKVGHDLIFLNFAGGIVYNERNEILLQKRGDRNEWGFPGGAMELGESIEETAKREIFEETGLTVEVEHLIGVYSKYIEEYPNGDKAQSIVYSFQCKPISGKLTSDGIETLDLKFFPLDQIPPLFTKSHEDALEDWLSKRTGVFR